MSILESLEKIKEKFDENKNYEQAISSIIEIFEKENNDFRKDVANCVFEYDPKIQKALTKYQWEPRIKKHYNEFISNGNIVGFAMLYSTMTMINAARDKIGAETVVELVKNIFDEKSFTFLEQEALKEVKEIMISTMRHKGEKWISKDELIKSMIQLYTCEVKGTYYENTIKKLAEEAASEIN